MNDHQSRWKIVKMISYLDYCIFSRFYNILDTKANSLLAIGSGPVGPRTWRSVKVTFLQVNRFQC